MNYSEARAAGSTLTGQTRRWSVGLTGLLLSACSSVEPLGTVDYVDLNRFMGDWYVIANIPTFLEKQAYNSVESYQLNDDGSIATTFTFNKGGFKGEKKQYHPVGFVHNTQTNAEWGMQFVWPIKADYRIIFLDADYQLTVIGRNKRDYVWLMARTPSIPGEQYEAMMALIKNAGYDMTMIREVPQQW